MWNTDHFPIFYVFSMVTIYKVLFCIMRPCGLEDGYHCCEGTCRNFLCDCSCTVHIPRCLTSLLPCRMRQQFPRKHLKAYIRFLGLQSLKIKSHLYPLLCLFMPWIYKNMSLTEAFEVLFLYTSSIVYHFHKFTAIFLKANLNNSSSSVQTIFHQFFHCCCQSQNNLGSRLLYSKDFLLKLT